jgi:hypothetical protein
MSAVLKLWTAGYKGKTYKIKLAQAIILLKPSTEITNYKYHLLQKPVNPRRVFMDFVQFSG